MLPRLAYEPMSSWLNRVGAVYELSAHELLDEWLEFATSSGQGHNSSVERRLDSHSMAAGATRMLVPDSAAPTLLTGPIGWVVENDDALPMCPWLSASG